MSFELFDARALPAHSGAGAGTAAVTVTDNRVLLINRAATEVLGDAEAVLLYVDRKRRAVGIGKAPPEDARAYKATKRGNSRQVAVSPTRIDGTSEELDLGALAQTPESIRRFVESTLASLAEESKRPDDAG